MTKRLVHVLLLLAVVLAAAVAHLSSIILPVKINSAVIEEFGKATGKNVFVGSVRFDIFRGLVLEDAVIYDRDSILIWAKRISCGLPILPLLNGQIVISSLKMDSPAIYVERRADNSFNIAELVPGPDEWQQAVMPGRIIIRNGRALFADRTLDPAFNERIDDIYMDMRLSAADKITVSLSCDIPARQTIYLKFSGTYNAAAADFSGKVYAKNLVPDEFESYYSAAGISFPSGDIDAEVNLRVKDDVAEFDIEGHANGLTARQGDFSLKLESLLKLKARYEFKGGALKYAGTFDARRIDLAGIEGLGRLENIKALVEFNDSRLWADDILADAFGMRWKARINVVNYSAPILDIYANTEARLSIVQKMLKDEFNIALPTSISGRADLDIAIQMRPDKPVRMNGRAVLREATVSLGEGNFPIEKMGGEVIFDTDGLKWSKISLMYRETPYVSSGELRNFAAPVIELEAASRDLAFRSGFSVKGRAIDIASLYGKYFNSAFSAAGSIRMAEKNVVAAGLKGSLDIDLRDLKKMAKGSAGLQKMKASGNIRAEFELKGNINDIKRCDLQTKMKSAFVSIYGMKLTDASINYVQAGGMGHIRSVMSRFYGGSLFASGSVDWTARAMPYSFSIDAKDVKLEKLKADAGFAEKNVSGDIKALANMTGTFRDISRLSGTGRISIKNGRIWQLDLFKGAGAIIFTSDFSDVVFTDGSCDIKFTDKGLIVNNLVMKSDLLNLYGSGTIGPGNSINAMLRPEIKEDSMGAGAQERIAMAVSGNTAIKVTGPIDKPEHKAQANFAEVVGGIAGAIFQQ